MSLRRSAWGGSAWGQSTQTTTVVTSFDLHAATPGVGSLPAGFSIVRASDAGYETGTGFVPSVGGVNVARVASMGGYVGLRIEGPTVGIGNELDHAGSIVDGDGVWVGPTVTGGILGPDGTNGAVHGSTPTDARIVYQLTSRSLPAGTHTLSVWAQKGTIAAFQFGLSASGVQFESAVTLTTGWVRYVATFTGLSANQDYALFGDGYSGISVGGIHAAQDANLAMPMFEQGPLASSWTATTRAGEVLHDTATAAGLNGRAEFRVRWIPDYSAAQMAAAGLTRARIVGADDNNCVEVETDRMQIRVVVDGVATLLPTVPPSWSALVPIDFDVSAVGGGPPMGTYAIALGSPVSLGMGDVLPRLRTAASGQTLSWFADTASPPGRQMWGAIVSASALAVGSVSPPTHVIYASPTGGGSSAGTIGDPASLAHAITLAAASLPAAPGSVQIVRRGGVYYTTVALTQAHSGLEIVDYPGEQSTIDAGTVVSGWADDGSGRGVYVATYAGAIRNALWVNGVRAIRARKAIVGWANHAGGAFTMNDASFAAFATMPEVMARPSGGPWKWVILKPASIVGTLYTVDATSWANAQSHVPITVGAADLLYAEGANELIDGTSASNGMFFDDRANGKLYYKPRAGEDMSTAIVVAGGTTPPLTITGARGATAAITVRGGILAGHEWLGPDAHGYMSEQTGIYGNCGGAGGLAAAVLNLIPGAVQLQYASGSVFTGVTVERCGGGGISVQIGTQGAKLIGCTATDCGGYGIAIGTGVVTADWQPTDPRDQVSGNLVRDCSMLGCAVTYFDCTGGVYGYVSDTTWERCELGATSGAGGLASWGGFGINVPSAGVVAGNIVRFNYIHDHKRNIPGTAVHVADLGALYFATESGVLVQNNYVVGSPGDGGAIYCDAATSGAIVGDVDGGSGGGNVTTGPAGYDVFLQDNSPVAVNCKVRGNFFSGNQINVTADPSNTTTPNTMGTSASTILAAGRI
jgi:hypothetical protein